MTKRYQLNIEESIREIIWPHGPIYEIIEGILHLGGKRIRPLLMLLGYKVLGGNSPIRVINQALALEFFHNFTLLHDDIMDQATLRRGKTTAHIQFGTPITILAGDALQAIAYQYLIKNIADGDLAVAIIERFNEVVLQVCEGQQEDLQFETKFPTPEAYLQMIRKKTAVLLGLSLRIGGMLARANNPKRVDLLEEFGVHFGLAYQLQDDYLDFYGTEAELGKQIGGDILNQKRTILILLAVDQLGQAPIEKGFAIEEISEKMNYFREIFNQAAVEEQTQERIAYHHNKALQILKTIKGNTIYLEEILQQSMERKK